MKNIVIVFISLLLAGCAALHHQDQPLSVVGVPPVAQGDSARTQPAPLPNGGRAPLWSPDGRKIAFLSSTLHTSSDLWVMNADGTGARRLTTRGVQSFRWGADSSSISFVTRRKGYEEVMSIGLDGTAERRISALPPGAGVPEYSPDGSLYAVIVPGEQGVRDLWIGTADGSRLEAVTEKIGIRSLFWSPNSRTIYYEAGKSYGVGLWEINLATMESKALLNKYIGTPEYSQRSGRVAYPYPTNPGEFEVRTMKLDGSDEQVHKAPRLAGRWLVWDTAGQGVYYLGQDLLKVKPAENGDGAKDAKPAAPHEKKTSGELQRSGVTSVWRLDLATGEETRISPEAFHVAEFSLAADGTAMVLSGVLAQSLGSDIFLLDLQSSVFTPLTKSIASAWMPLPSPDASKIAFFTNEGTLDVLKVVKYTGEELAIYPGFVLEGDTRFFWLPASEGLALFSGRGLFAFSEKGPIEFTAKGDHRIFLYADASIQQDKLLISAVPRYGQ